MFQNLFKIPLKSACDPSLSQMPSMKSWLTDMFWGRRVYLLTGATEQLLLLEPALFPGNDLFSYDG